MPYRYDPLNLELQSDQILQSLRYHHPQTHATDSDISNDSQTKVSSLEDDPSLLDEATSNELAY
jgi:hypothetical protein